MPVKQRGDSWQVDFRHSGERIRKSFDSEVKALQWEAWAKMRLSKGEPLKEVAGGEVQTMRSLCQACCARYWRGTPNESNAIRNAEEMVDLLGAENHPKDIKPSDIDRVIGVLRERGNSAGTINRKLSALGKMFTHAVTRGIIDRKPHWDSIKESQGRLRWFTPEEESLILGWLHQNGLLDFRDLVVFLLDTGCRLGEACPKDDRKPGLLWRDVDDTYARFHETKGGGSRAVPLTQRCREMLVRRRRPEMVPTDSVFADINCDRAEYLWNRVRAGLGWEKDPEAVLHTLRHILVQAGVPIQVVQQWLGHKTLKMTLRYAHLAPVNLLSAVKVLEVTTPTDTIRPIPMPNPVVTGVTPAATVKAETA